MQNDVLPVRIDGTLTLLSVPSEISGKNASPLAIFTKVYKTCSTVCSIINRNAYTGSGSFISLSSEDRKFGYFMTAAHMVMTMTSTTRIVASKVFITDPRNNNYTTAAVENIFIDGVADVAILKTMIDLSDPQFDNCILSLATPSPSIGDSCFICGNPGGWDTDSFSSGIVRDNHYTEPSGSQCVDSIFVTAPGIGGNSGSPIVDIHGAIIGIFTFGMSSNETLGGGANWDTLTAVLPQLLTDQDNRSTKKYIGVKYTCPSALDLMNLYEPNSSNLSQSRTTQRRICQHRL
jgi:S1-C subfamily serine protease